MARSVCKWNSRIKLSHGAIVSLGFTFSAFVRTIFQKFWPTKETRLSAVEILQLRRMCDGVLSSAGLFVGDEAVVSPLWQGKRKRSCLVFLTIVLKLCSKTKFKFL